jgi:hypothetical protein
MRDMDFNPPAGSQISINRDDVDPTIVIPATGSSTRYFGGVFLLFWLGGWFMGESSAINQLLSGKGGVFIVFWLGAWTVAGVLAAYTAYRIFRPPVPETLKLHHRAGVAYDSGIAPLQLNWWGDHRNTKDRWKSIFPKRIKVDLDRQQLQSLRLRETETGNRLTVDVDAQRIDIASHASEVEREWLAKLLAQRYALPQISASIPGSEV